MKPWWAGFFLSLSLCIDLGVVNVTILRTALRQGGTAGFLVGIGSCVGDLIYFTLAALGAAALLKWAPFRWILWLLGTSALLLLAWRMVRETIHPKKFDIDWGRQGNSTEHASGLLASGLALALASPTAILWFTAIGGSVIASFGVGGQSLYEFAAGFVGAGVTWSALFAYSAAGLGRWFGERVRRALCFVSALLFLYLAILIFITGLRQTL